MTAPLTSDPRFRSWLSERAVRRAPPDLLARAMRAVDATPQASGWQPADALARMVTPLGVLTAVALVAVVGLTMWGRVGSVTGPPPTATPSTPASVSVAPTTDPDPTPRPPQPTGPPVPAATARPSAASPPAASAFGTWVRHSMPDPAPDFLGGAIPADIVRLGARYVALPTRMELGMPGNLGGTSRVWLSADGRTWELADAAGIGAADIHQVVSDGTRAVAVGEGAPDWLSAPESDPPVAWTSADGLNWSPIEGDAPSVVAVGPNGFLGVSHRVSGRSRFVTSSDGVTWTPAASGTDAFWVEHLAIDPVGRVIAIGAIPGQPRPDGSSTVDLLLWRSEDGDTWDKREVIARDARGLAVVGDARGHLIAGWHSVSMRDGSIVDVPTVWRITPGGVRTLSVPAAPGDVLSGLAAIDDTLILTGERGADGVTVPIVFVSSDGGGSWGQVPAQPGFEGANVLVTGVLATDEGLLAIGRRLDSFGGHFVGVAWTAAR